MNENVVRAFGSSPEIPKEGLKTLVSMAETLLERCKSGHVTAFVAATLQRDAGVGSTWSVPFDNPVILVGMLEVAKQRILAATVGEEL